MSTGHESNKTSGESLNPSSAESVDTVVLGDDTQTEESRANAGDRAGAAAEQPGGLRIRVSDALWGVLAAVLFAYPVWQAFAFAFANSDTGWQAVFAGLGWVRWTLLLVGLVVPLALLAASWWITRGMTWWRRLLTYVTGWAVVPLIMISVQQLVMANPQVNDIVLSHLLFGE
ncbi:hypothetical protein [Pseudoclavibacter sp. 13-3]|uniref:hypothetical protein n=1 Tax=Pseudoclavibacter sp. 13-3 TaxID=2901228 RepID=UPI001E5D407D|nr:hypothetical protein [Pseudoclavibacter sp. 13-3]MCD7102340.1 hypothetical protein [Pseudoclavibacter sp. 13-3]